MWRPEGEASNGRDAVAKAKQLSPDVVVMDLAMPQMNGFEAARFSNGSMSLLSGLHERDASYRYSGNMKCADEQKSATYVNRGKLSPSVLNSSHPAVIYNLGAFLMKLAHHPGVGNFRYIGKY